MKTNAFRGPVYICMSDGNAVPARWEIAIQGLVDSLRTKSAPGFRASVQYFGLENHVSLPLLGLYHGLNFVFEGYSPTADNWDKPAGLSAHFKQVSQELGYPVLPPEEYIDGLGSWELDSAHDTNAALACLQLNVSNYPASFNVWQSLGNAFRAIGDKDSAMKCFTRSRELKPNNRGAVEQIRRLRPISRTGPATKEVSK